MVHHSTDLFSAPLPLTDELNLFNEGNFFETQTMNK